MNISRVAQYTVQYSTVQFSTVQCRVHKGLKRLAYSMTIDSHLYSSESVFCSVPSYTPLWFKFPLLYSTLLYSTLLFSSLSFILFESNIFCEYFLFSWHLLSSTLFSYLLLSSVVSSSLPLSSPLFYSLLFSSFRLYHDPVP